MPFASLGPLFKGRDELVDLRRRLRSGPCQVIHGLGGVGKTRLAIEYAWRHAGEYTALLFVSARSPVELRANLAGLCNPLVLNLPDQTQPEEAARVSAVFRRLCENPRWLLILDNADTQEAASGVEEVLPRLPGGQVIITSRIADWSPAVQTAEPVNVLDETEASAFLLERTEAKRRKTLADPQEALALRILAEFEHCTGHEHPHFHRTMDNYAILISAMGLSQAEILARLRSAIESEPKESA